RANVQVLENVVAAVVALGLGHPARRILHVAEDDRAGGTGLGAGGHDVAIPQGAILQPRGVLRRADPLHAESALLHHAAGPHRHLGIELQVERLREGGLGVRVPVVVAHLVGAVIGAVAGADAAVVHLPIEPVVGVVGGVHRADRLAGGVVAVLAQHRHHPGLERLAILATLPVALDAHPGHLAAAQDVGLPDEGDVVLGVAGGDAGGTAGAAGQVDDHAPHRLLVGVLPVPPRFPQPRGDALEAL